MSKQEMIAKHNAMIADADAMPFGVEKGNAYKAASKLATMIRNIGVADTHSADIAAIRCDARTNGHKT